MCGIFVAFHPGTGQRPIEQCIRGVEAASHRGPDNLGTFSDDTCFLGHNRLSIIGIDKNGNQPFHFGDLVMVFNGEVFNYIELREELVSLGYAFETHSDTEVVLKAYHRWGGDCFARFNGMWALAIYDRGRKTLVASRDRFGQKPMFVMEDGGAVFIASEVQQLAHLSDKGPDMGLIQMFLKEGTYEGDGRTFFEAIQEFPKSHYCVFGPDGSREARRYWDYWGGEIGRVDTATLAEFTALLEDAVRIRLRADVPFGVLVSGGVDSTLIAAYARKHAEKDAEIPAFTYASGDRFDESAYARAVAERLRLNLVVREQDANPSDYRSRLKDLVRHLGRGHSSPAVVSVDYLYESVSRTGIKVALDGQGADELLAGYKNYFVLVVPWFLLRGEFRQAWLCFRDQLRFGFRLSLLLWLRNVLPEPCKRLGRYLYGYEKFFRRLPVRKRTRIVSPQGRPARNRNALNRYLIWHHNLGLENLLYYGDIVAMKNSVENRSPFMDHRLVDFAFSKAEGLKLKDAVDKYALRASPAYSGFKDVLDREKIGFSSDVKAATKASMVKELENSAILRWPLFSAEMGNFIKTGGFEDPKYDRLLFRLYQVHLWNEIFLQPNPNPPPLPNEDESYASNNHSEAHVR